MTVGYSALSASPSSSMQVGMPPPPTIVITAAQVGPKGDSVIASSTTNADTPTANATVSGPGVVVPRAGYLPSVTVVLHPPGAATSDPVTLTDGPGGTVLAIVGMNVPLGDIPLFRSKRFATSLVAVATANSPTIAVGYA